MGGKCKSDLPKWLRSKQTGDKAFKNVYAAGRVFMLEFRVSRPIDIPRAHLALLFDFSGSCQTGDDGQFRLIAGTLAHVVVNNAKTRETQLELRHVSSKNKHRFLDPASISRVYLLGRLNHHPMSHPKDLLDFVSMELENLYQSLVESEESLSEGEISVVKRCEYEEKRDICLPKRRTHSRQPTPSISLTESGSMVWKVSDAKGEELWYTKDEVMTKPKPLKDSTQSIILTYAPAQREQLRKTGLPVTILSSDSLPVGAMPKETGDDMRLSSEFESHPRPPEESCHNHGPYWGGKLNCVTFCKLACYHWPELVWPSEGLCAPILWPLPSLNVHLVMGNPPSPATLSKHPFQPKDKVGTTASCQAPRAHGPGAEPSKTAADKPVDPTREQRTVFARFLYSLERRMRALFRRIRR